MISALLVEVSSSGGGAVAAHTPAIASCALVIAALGQRRIDRRQHRRRALAVRSHHDPVRMQEVHDRRALAQKLRVRHHVEPLPRRAVALHRLPNPLVRVHRHRALFHDHRVLGQRPRNLARHRLHIGEIGIARLALRRAHRDKDRLRLARRLRQIGREPDLPVAIPPQQLRQMFLVDQRRARTAAPPPCAHRCPRRGRGGPSPQSKPRLPVQRTRIRPPQSVSMRPSVVHSPVHKT